MMMHRSRSRVAAWIFAAIVAMSAASFASSARADALDCLTEAAKVTIDPSTLMDVIEFQTKYGQCNTYLANPTPVFAITLSLVVGAMATDILPTDAEGCINAIPNAAAKLALAAIDALGLPLPLDLKEKLNSEAPGVAQKAYNDLLAKPEFAVLAAIANMFNCACAIAAFGEDAAKKFIEAADSCGEVIGDIAAVFVSLGGAVVEGFEGLVHSGGCLITAWFGGCAGSAPGSYDPCYGASCPTGQQCFPPALAAQYPKLTKNPDPQDHKQNCGSCGAVSHGVGLGPGKCGCSGGYVGNYEFNYYGADQKVLKSCACPAPLSSYYVTAAYTQGWSGKWVCACPVGKKLIGGKCELNCRHDEVATPQQDLTIVLAGSVWSCQPCASDMTSDGKGPCRPLCAPNEHLVADPLAEIASTLEQLPSQIFGSLGTKTKESIKITETCQACPAGSKADGKNPCIPCEGDNSYVAGGVCQSCKPWQKVHLVSIKAGGSRCEDICPNGSILVDPNAPGPLTIPDGSQPVKAIPPGSPAQSAKGGGATPQAASEVGGGDMTALPKGGAKSGEAVSATPVLVPMCIPCGQNEYVENNKCHDCGPKAVVNIAAKTCTSCSSRQVVKLIGGALTCAVDCSDFGRVAGVRPSPSNYITDPKDKNRCIPCEPGSKPNDSHTACITTITLDSRPTGPVTTGKNVPLLPGKGKRTNKGEGSAVKAQPGPAEPGRPKGKAGATVKRNCPPRMHPNPSGTGCVPDLDMPGITDGGSTRPGGPASRRGR